MRVSDSELKITLPDGSETLLAYRAWGEPDHPRLVLMVHGLTRNGRDFDALAAEVAKNAFVLCPDMPGRGRSPALKDAALYNYPTYLGGLAQLMALHPRAQIQWVGTSMGGILGMMSAAGNPAWVKDLVLNDVGARVPAAGMRRIAAYASRPQNFADQAAGLAYLRATFGSFGFVSDAEWQAFADISLVIGGQGGFTLNYDPALTASLAEYLKTDAAKEDIDLTAFWEKVSCPTLLLRGAMSDILPRMVAEEMARKPHCELVEIPDTGHAPGLVSAEQVALVSGWLNQHCAPSP